MDLNGLWFGLIGLIFCCFFFLEGFDYGVAMLMPFVSKKNDTHRRILINSIGPVWDGNEVWMILAGGAIFAVFPNWYATLFSGFYPFMFIILAALIFRNVTFEFRDKINSPLWRSICDKAFFFGSLIPAFIWGVLLADLVLGVPIDSKMEFAGGFFSLIQPLALLGGLLSLLMFILHGSLYILLKTEKPLVENALKLAKTLSLVAAGAIFVLALILTVSFQLFSKALPAICILLALVLLAAIYVGLIKNRHVLSFIASGLSIASLVAATFASLFPNVMISSLDSKWNLTIYNASSGPYTLKIITIVALVMVPVIIVYQSWTYWVFKKRLNAKSLEY